MRSSSVLLFLSHWRQRRHGARKRSAFTHPSRQRCGHGACGAGWSRRRSSAANSRCELRHAVFSLPSLLNHDLVRGSQPIPRFVVAARYSWGAVVRSLTAAFALGSIWSEGAIPDFRVGAHLRNLLCPRFSALLVCQATGIEDLCARCACNHSFNLEVVRPRRRLRSERAAVHFLVLCLGPLLLFLGLRLAVAPQQKIRVSGEWLLRLALHAFDELRCEDPTFGVDLGRNHLHFCGGGGHVLILLGLVVHPLHVDGLELRPQLDGVETEQKINNAASLVVILRQGRRSGRLEAVTREQAVVVAAPCSAIALPAICRVIAAHVTILLRDCHQRSHCRNSQGIHAVTREQLSWVTEVAVAQTHAFTTAMTV
mmetsp:Transcript_46796/g.124250  ORF Transcript_46796/g.124250 Transcript_46796/m.124250 type:complete len:369 (-) Transcript_46796:1847-2953(-)